MSDVIYTVFEGYETDDGSTDYLFSGAFESRDVADEYSRSLKAGVVREEALVRKLGYGTIYLYDFEVQDGELTYTISEKNIVSKDQNYVPSNHYTGAKISILYGGVPSISVPFLHGSREFCDEMIKLILSYFDDNIKTHPLYIPSMDPYSWSNVVCGGVIEGFSLKSGVGPRKSKALLPDSTINVISNEENIIVHILNRTKTSRIAKSGKVIEVYNYDVVDESGNPYELKTGVLARAINFKSNKKIRDSLLAEKVVEVCN